MRPGRPSGPTSRLFGSARHEAMAELQRTQDAAKIDYALIAAKWHVEADDVRKPIVSCGYVPPPSARWRNTRSRWSSTTSPWMAPPT